MSYISAIAKAFSSFAVEVNKKLAAGGAPEANIRSPLESLLGAGANALGLSLTLSDEARISALGVRPDWSATVGGALVGHVEIKAPGKGADVRAYTGHDAEQWGKLKALPNVLYTDGNQWGLYRSGNLVQSIAYANGDVRTSGSKITIDGEELARIISAFLHWQPVPPQNTEELTYTTASLCRLLRSDVETVILGERALPPDQRIFSDLADDWRKLLFPDASNREFADVYAQTVTFALLLARAEHIDLHQPLAAVASRLASKYGLMGRALEILTTAEARDRIATSLSTLVTVLSVVDWSTLQIQKRPKSYGSAVADSPWLYFYEHFLAEYDPKLREDVGAYYTPPEVVHAQVAIVEDLLKTGFNKQDLGFADENVVVLDPAMGTGSYLVEILAKAASAVAIREGPGAVPARLDSLCSRLIGFEITAGPFAVAEVLLGEALRTYDPNLDPAKMRLFLADTLEDPFAQTAQLGGIYAPIARSRTEANKIKRETKVLVCIGNPPYDRHDKDNSAGGWIRNGNAFSSAPLGDFIHSNIKPSHYRSVYNLYVYFWRWALWKVFESTADHSGVVAFISSSSFVAGDAGEGMRNFMRSCCDEIWVLDLGGDGRGGRTEENVFNIQTPVAITFCVRRDSKTTAKKAIVHYCRISGSRQDKLRILSDVTDIKSLSWRPAREGSSAPLLPAPVESWANVPEMNDLFCWGAPGATIKRTWPIAGDAETLSMRWSALDAVKDVAQRAILFKEDVHGKLDKVRRPLPGYGIPDPLILTGGSIGNRPPIVRYSYRSFDREWILADSRLMAQPSPTLWSSLSDNQLFIAGLNARPTGSGPALVCTTHVPDLNFHSNRGGRIWPLWRDALGRSSNIVPNLLSSLSAQLSLPIGPEDFTCYVMGVAGTSAYAEIFAAELAEVGVRVPLTLEMRSFCEFADIGAEVIYLQTFGERKYRAFTSCFSISKGSARVIKPIAVHPRPLGWRYEPETGTLHVGQGEIGQVADYVMDFKVSGMHVVRNWLNHRIGSSGRRTSGLNDVRADRWDAILTTELLELLWVLERSVALAAAAGPLLLRLQTETLMTRQLLLERKVLPVPPSLRKRPAVASHASVVELFIDSELSDDV